MIFEDIHNLAYSYAAENLLVHIRNMIDDTESIVDEENRKILQEARHLVGDVMKNIWDDRRVQLKKLEVKE